MNRLGWLAVVGMMVALPALADGDRWRDWERERGRDFREQPVTIEKRRVQWMLMKIDNHLADIISHARGPDRRALKDLRDELTDVRDLLNGAQTAGQPLPPGPPQQQPPGYYPPQQQPPPPPPPPQPVGQPLPDQQFRGLLGAMSRESFANDKLRVLEQASATSYFLVPQVQQLLSLFEFPADRLRAVRVVRNRILDTNNFFQLYGAFEFPRDKEELRRILGQ